MRDDRATDITLTAPAWTRAAAAAGSAAFVAVGWFMLTLPTKNPFYHMKLMAGGSLAIVFFGACALVCAIQLIPRFRDRITVSESGFSVFRRFRLNHHAWGDVVGNFSLWTYRRTNQVVFSVAGDRRNLNRVLTGHTRYLPSHLGIPAARLVELMNGRLDAYRRQVAGNARPYQPHDSAPAAVVRQPVFGRKST